MTLSLSRLATPAGTERPLLGHSNGTGRLSPKAESTAAPTVSAGTKLACFNWPPPPSPASSSKPSNSSALPNFKGGASGLLVLGGTGELNLGDTGSSSGVSLDMKNRGELWEIRSEIEREKLRMVAPYPFFGNPMRFSDDFAAMQITEDGRFSYSEMLLEAAEAEGSNPIKSSRSRIVTYEGVFSGPYTPGEDEEDQQVAPGKGKHKESKAEEQKAEPDHELAAIEATALVKHEMAESGGRSKLVLVERGVFRFAITVSPFFHPNYATIKVLVRNRSPGHPPPRARKLPYVGPGGPSKLVGGTMKRCNSSTGFVARQPRDRRKAGSRLKGSGSMGLLPSASPWASRNSLQAAGAGSLGTLGLASSISSQKRPSGFF